MFGAGPTPCVVWFCWCSPGRGRFPLLKERGSGILALYPYWVCLTDPKDPLRLTDPKTHLLGE